MSKTILIHNSECPSYPKSDECFAPGNLFPEYPFNQISKSTNNVYVMVRDLFHEMGYDSAHYGTSDWNPLGDFLWPGATVLLKPNWVMHVNHNRENPENLDCLVTNPSVVRAVLDYVVIAYKKLNENLRIIVADAPMQGCNLEKLFAKTGYDRLFAFYREQSIPIEIVDLRKYHVEVSGSGVISEPIETDSRYHGIKVELGGLSMHAENDGKGKKYKVSDYAATTTAKYHNDASHSYEINECALQADLILNLPKPKAHRLAGFTGAMKNFVGITFDKACLPHRSVGSIEENGDAYLKKSYFKALMDFLDEMGTSASLSRKMKLAWLYKASSKVAYCISRVLGSDPYRIGSWYGNDTIWRTVYDLNVIAQFADKNGMIQKVPQRKILSLGDMIVAGEKNGPVSPSPKEEKILLFSDSVLCFDEVVCKLFNYDSGRFKIFVQSRFPELSNEDNALMIILDNGGRKSGVLSAFSPDPSAILHKHPNWVAGKKNLT